MATNVASPRSTGGGGFVFEDDVCAWLLACMLIGEPIFGPEHGVPVRLDFQTRPDGWFLDDVLVTTAVGSSRLRFALSVKSNTQFTATSAPSDFVAAAWEQWLHIGSAAFDASRDFIGLVTGPLSGAAARSVSGLSEKVRVNDAAIFPMRLATPSWANEDERALFASFACPAGLGRMTTEVDTARLLQRLRFVQRDFGSVASESHNTTLELCRRAVRSHTAADAEGLWSALRDLAAELRPRAGSLTLSELIERLRARVLLADYPDHASDWTTLDARSAREVALVRDSIGGVHLSRVAQAKVVADALSTNFTVTLLGSSGVGKSGLAKSLFEHRRTNVYRTLWIDASSLDRAADLGAFEASLRLRYPLAELLDNVTSREPLLVLDGLDRLYTDHAFRAVASLLRMVSSEAQSTGWRVLAICQSQEWPRVLEALQRAGAAATHWRSHEAAALKPSELQPIRDAVQALGRLLLQPRVGPLLTNLKLLDLVVRRLEGGTEIDASAWVGESSVADWFWSAEIDRGSDRLARGQFARGLAQAQADQLAASISVDTLDAGTLGAAQSLVADQLLVQVPGDRLAFAHDLYGDWVRLRILLNQQADLAAFLRGRHGSPLWHRAIRLLGIRLLERENGVTEWKTLMSSFDSDEMAIVRDLLLEAPAFAMNAGTLLESVFRDLVAGDGVLLRRLLTRFLAFATVPHERMMEVARSTGMDVNAARAAFRRPHWPYWVDVLAVLHAHRDDVLRVAASEVAKIVEMWLEYMPPGTVRRREAAELALMLGRRTIDSRTVYRGRESDKNRERFYKCALRAAPERPDEVADFAKVAAERVPRTASPADDAGRARNMFGTGVIRGPWPDGPLARVDDAFQRVVWDGPSIRELYQVRPAVAREVILATLIEAPYEEQWGSGRTQERELDLVDDQRWTPSLYTQGPFLMCLRDNFAEGLELAMRLIDFATERSNHYETRQRNDWRAHALEEGRSEAEVEHALKTATPQRLALYEGTNELSFSGDAGSYSWSAGLTSPEGYSPLPPRAVTPALMALEQHFYQRISAGEDITDGVAAALARSRSVAPLGVLVDIGKRQPSLFDGPLRALLSAPELYAWDIRKLVQGRMHLGIGAVSQGEYFVKFAQRFHGLEHRKRDLRLVAMDRVLKSAEMKSFFATVREWWKRRRAAGEPLIEMTDQLDLWLDPANYEVREDPTHGPVIVNVALERAQAGRAEERRVLDDRMLIMTSAVRCRDILEKARLQTDAELEGLWQSWVRVRELAKNDPTPPGNEGPFGDGYANAIAGGVAVFLWHAEWLSRHEARRAEIENALLADDGAPPARREFDSERDVSTWNWECFLAEAAAMLWAREPRDPRWRRLVAEAIFSHQYAALTLLFSRCAESRSLLREDFARLRRLAVDWAYLRERINALLNWQRMAPNDANQTERLQVELSAWVEQLVASFVDGTLEPLSSDWSQVPEAHRFQELDDIRRRWSASRLLDFHVVRCSHEWLPLPDEASSAEERADVIQFWRVALDVVASRPRADLTRRDHQYPEEDEQWVLDHVAAVVLQLRPDENAEQLWAPIIDLHSEAHDWPEVFLNALHARGLSAEQTPATYGPLVGQMAHRAFSDVEGAERWPRYEEVWDALLGVDSYVGTFWAERHAEHVVAIWHVVDLWMKKAPQDGWRLQKFTRWLSNSAAAAIRLRALPWLLSLLQADEERRVHRDEEAEDDVAKLLNVVWAQDQNRLRAAPESFAAFRGLLVWLVGRQNTLGLELQGRLGGLA